MCMRRFRPIAGAFLTAVIALLCSGRAEAQLVASYAMNEANWNGSPPQVLDSSGNGYNGTAVGGANTAYDAIFGQVGSFNGSGQYVSIGGSGSIANQGARTILAWVDPSSAGIGYYGMPILTGGAYAAGDFFGIAGTGGSDGGAAPYQLYVDSWFHGPSAVSTVALTPNQWNFVALTYSGGYFTGNNLDFYVNGAAAGSTSYQMYGYNIDTYDIGGNTIGGTSTTGSLDGLMRDVAIYDTALTPDEIQNIYASESPSATPEPNAFALLGGLGISGAACLTRRRKAKRPVR